ncbi:MAG TPA: HD domain-containing phosphohydrolase [Candidatus Dormibacteraeota bacterium]
MSEPRHPTVTPELLLEQARTADLGGDVAVAIRGYGRAIQVATERGATVVLADALRCLSVLHHRRNEPETARALCARSLELGRTMGDGRIIAHALNTLAGFAFEAGNMTEAHRLFEAALGAAAAHPTIAARVEQNLGMLHAVSGDLDQALAHYHLSLRALERAGDAGGQAVAHHNLGLAAIDRKKWTEAERHLGESLRLARATGDRHIEALCLLNRSGILVAQQRYDEARTTTEEALQLFGNLESEIDKADAYRMLGVVFRETGRPQLAEARLQEAIQKAQSTGGLLAEAEARQELAILYQAQNRNREALTLLNASYQVFGRVNALGALRDIAAKVADLENAYLSVVKDWGQSIESADGYTYGHCGRVAEYAVAVAAALGLSAAEQRTIRLGAYLHDVGKVRVPHEVLNKPGRLTNEEFALIKMHPVWGAEMLAEIEFPWELIPIIRWHHERYDGRGYPDGLTGEAIPLHAQIVSIADVWDALTTNRSYRPAMSAEQAHGVITRDATAWSPRILAAFISAMTESATLGAVGPASLPPDSARASEQPA